MDGVPSARARAKLGRMTISEADLVHLRRAVELAREALDAGDGPFGSVLVDAGVHEALTAHDEGGEDDSPWRWRRLRRVSAKGFKNLDAWRVRARHGDD